MPRSLYMRAILGADNALSTITEAKPRVSGREVLIHVAAAGVNRADLLQRANQYKPPPGTTEVLGLECSGRIKKVGEEAIDFSVGDRVVALLKGGAYADYVAVDERCVFRIPHGLPLVEAAAIPEAWTTAFQLIDWYAGTKKGDRVLVHAAGSGVGLAAIQLARARGAEVVATAGSDEKLEVARQLGAAEVINYKEQPKFSDQLIGREVQVVLDCIGASHWKENLKSIAVDGRWVLYGLLGGPRVYCVSLATLLRKRISLAATTLRSRPVGYQAALFSATCNEVMPRIADGRYRSVLHEVVPFESADQAHKILLRNENIGKVVLSVNSIERYGAPPNLRRS